MALVRSTPLRVIEAGFLLPDWPKVHVSVAADRRANGRGVVSFNVVSFDVGSTKMVLQLPAGSAIQSHFENGVRVVIIPPNQRSPALYAGAAFLLVWLCMWAFGWVSAFHTITVGSAKPFVILWLVGWTLGGGWALYMLFRVLRPSVPESLTLNATSMSYDSGVSPPDILFGQRRPLRDYFPKRIRCNFGRDALASLTLRMTEAGNRLTIDLGTQRIYLASGVGEVEREWLYKVIVATYDLGKD